MNNTFHNNKTSILFRLNKFKVARSRYINYFFFIWISQGCSSYVSNRRVGSKIYPSFLLRSTANFFIDFQVVVVHLDSCCYFTHQMMPVFSKKFSLITKPKNMREGFTLVSVCNGNFPGSVHEELLQGQDFLGV